MVDAMAWRSWKRGGAEAGKAATEVVLSLKLAVSVSSEEVKNPVFIRKHLINICHGGHCQR